MFQGSKASSSSLSPQSMQIWAFGLLAAAIILLGLGLIVSTWPLDSGDIVELGAGLVTGGLIGIALTAFESALERRRTAQADRKVEQQGSDLIDYAHSLLGRLVVRHAQALYVLLLASPLQQADRSVNLEGTKVPRDLLLRGVQWAADKDEDEAAWYRNPRTVESIDAVLQTGVDLAKIENSQLGESHLEILLFHTEETADRLTKTADYLSQGGHPNAARTVVDCASNLRGAIMALPLSDFVGQREIQLPRADPQTDENGVVHIRMGSGMDTGLQFLSESVCYIANQLRNELPDATDGSAVAKLKAEASPRRVIDSLTNDEIVRLRWGRLLSASENNNLWSTRFEEGSWLRRALEVASAQVRWSWGVDTVHFPGS